MDTPTLLTKVLLPRRRDDVLRRQRLLDRLYDMVDYRLALVSAPAGYGKSTLLVDFAADLEHPVCWYALDASDRDPYLFVGRLVMSIRRRFPNFGADTRRALAAGSNLSGGALGLIRVLVNELVTDIPQWFVLVLDDYHALGECAEVDAIVSNFVTLQRDQCLTILASRTVPKLPLIIPLVARGGVGGIGQDEIRFSVTEIQELFVRNYDTELTQSEANALAEQSEGWIAGLLLTAYMRFQGVLQSWMRARSSQQPIYDYLAQEVFDGQPPDVQRFLTQTSTLSEMNTTLCEEALVISGAGRYLETVETQNLFVTRFEGDWFRYHHLFREFLQNRLKREDREQWTALHRRAASWFEAHEQLLSAIDHYNAIADYQEAAKLMTDLSRTLYVAGQFTTLMTWQAQLPADLLVSYPRLALFCSRAAYKIGDRDVAMALGEIAEEGYRGAQEEEGLVYAQLHQCEVLLSQGRLTRALTRAQETLSYLDETDSAVAYEAHRMLGRTYVRMGDLNRGYHHLHLALSLSRQQGNAYDAALVRTSLAQCLGRQGKLTQAIELNREAIGVWRRLGSEAALADELNDLGFHLYSLGDYDEAMACFQEALTVGQRAGFREAEAVSLVNLGELARDLLLHSQAIAYLERGHALAREIDDRFLSTYATEALGLVYRAQDRLAEAHRLIESALAAAQEQRSDYQVGRYRASLGALLAESGKPLAGLREIEDALTTMDELALSTDMYRTRLLRAWATYLSDDAQIALEQLGELLDGRPTVSEAQVFVAEGHRLEPLYREALEAFRHHPNRHQHLQRMVSRVTQLAATGERLFPRRSSDTQKADIDLKVHGFGHERVTMGGEEIPANAWGAATARHLLFYMLVHGARSRDQIFYDFWPDLPAGKAKATFHTTKFRLHRALGQEIIDFDGRMYTLHPDLQAWFDVTAFRAALARWQSSGQLSALIEAVGVYDGDFLADCYLDWCVNEREALRVTCIEALDTLAERLLGRRQYRRAADVLSQALALEPARERFHQQLMRAFALSGQRSRALAQFEACRQALEQDLDAAPSQSTRDLYQRILNESGLD